MVVIARSRSSSRWARRPTTEVTPWRPRPTRSPAFDPRRSSSSSDLAENNDRAWFHAAQGRLRAPPQGAPRGPVRRPRRAVPGAEHPAPRRPARSPFRIYRDVRFSKDKSPYKTNVSASFPWTADGLAHEATGRLLPLLAPGEMYIGGGMWHPEPARAGRLARPRRSGGVGLEVARRPGLRRDVRRDPRRLADARATGLPEGPPRGRPAQAQGHDLRSAAVGRRRAVGRSAGRPRRRLREGRAGLPDAGVAAGLTGRPLARP